MLARNRWGTLTDWIPVAEAMSNRIGAVQLGIVWQRLTGLMDEVAKPVFLGGGVNAENVGEAIRILRPYAVDVSSGVEIEKGSMDTEMIEEFCRRVREADGA